jgi:hypothetical protein
VISVTSHPIGLPELCRPSLWAVVLKFGCRLCQTEKTKQLLLCPFTTEDYRTEDERLNLGGPRTQPECEQRQTKGVSRNDLKLEVGPTTTSLC